MKGPVTVIFILFSLARIASAQNINLDDFKDDGMRMNAVRLLNSMWETNNRPVAALEKALDSTDYQQRQIAAEVLRHTGNFQPTRRLLEVTIEGLRDDQYPYGDGACIFVFNAASGMIFLMKHGKAAKELLLPVLESDDLQQRFIAAYILGIHGITDELEATANILIPHLRSNDITQDACMASSALFRLGRTVIPFLKEALPGSDRQQWELIELIMEDLNDPPESRKELRARKDKQHITSLVYDPVLEYEPCAFYFPSGLENIRKAVE